MDNKQLEQHQSDLRRIRRNELLMYWAIGVACVLAVLVPFSIRLFTL